jgi:predicted RNA-binding protein YlqC (UPF0109 family)
MGNSRVGPEVTTAVKEVIMIVRHFVDHPDDVEVNIRPGPYRITAELYTHPRDVGQVVGRNGYVASSLRAFLAAIAGKHRIKIDLDYVTEEDNARSSAKDRASAS